MGDGKVVEESHDTDRQCGYESHHAAGGKAAEDVGKAAETRGGLGHTSGCGGADLGHSCGSIIGGGGKGSHAV